MKQQPKQVELSLIGCVHVLVNGEVHISICKKQNKNKNDKKRMWMVVPVYGTKL